MSRRQKIPIVDLVRSADADLVRREKSYPEMIANGRISREGAERDLQERRQIVDVLVLFQRFEGAFRETALRELANVKSAEAAMKHPAVENVLEVFPDAEVFVRDLPTFSPELEEHPEP